MIVENYFKGLADANRLRIMNLLLHGELCGCDIQYVLEASQSNVSRHLGYLNGQDWWWTAGPAFASTIALPMLFPGSTGT